ncbi:MAG: hypothetical protein J0L55_06960 [Caulobacterales bacterium]|nr:hypothetical protein [Caulobacterales bacterium]MCA0373246.1 hypothetical protein [Pseudomonadota bacterium]
MDATSEIVGNSPVRQAIAEASKSTGADFGFLLATAVRESSLNPKAEARTSSATGLFQFLDQSWLTTLKRHGAKHGLENEAAMISLNSDGKAYVDDPQIRRKLLNLRYDARISSLMAAEFSNDNAQFIKARTGNEPQAGDLYAAHFLGAAGAANLINAAQDTPWVKASELFPAAAAANRPVFYRDGRALSVAEVLQNLRKTTENTPNIGKDEFSNPANFPNPQLILAQLQTSWNQSLLNMMTDGGVGENLNNNQSFSPQMLAQFYQTQDQISQNKAIEIAAGALENNDSLAMALLPKEQEEEPKQGLALRGRK